MNFNFKIIAAIIGLTFCINVTMAQDSTFNYHKDQRFSTIAGSAIPAGLLIYGCLKPAINGIQTIDDNIKAQVTKNYPGFETSSADYIMWTPSASIYLMDALQVKTEHSFKEHLILDAGSLIITGGVGLVMRKISGNMEVYSKQGTKFPSGHTTNAFRGAEIFHQELKNTHEVLSYAGYVVATGVGLLRIYGKAHLLSEVISGAGLGILSTKLTYWLFKSVKRKNWLH